MIVKMRRKGQVENRHNQALLSILSDLEELDRRYTERFSALLSPAVKYYT